MVRRFGLDHQAASDVSRVFASAHTTSNAITGVGYVMFIFGGIAAATAVQDLYERSFRLESRGVKDMPRQAAWLAVLVGFGALAGWVGPHIGDVGGPVLQGLIGFVALVGFWWFTMWFLLGGRVPARDVVPSAVATSLFWVGMTLVFRLTFSNSVVSDYDKYGAIGVVFAFMSWLIAIGVVIILGAIVGLVWREQGLSFASAFRRLRRARTRLSRSPTRRRPPSSTRSRAPGPRGASADPGPVPCARCRVRSGSSPLPTLRARRAPCPER